MTRTPFRKAAFPAFRKPTFAALLLSATMLAGCATNRTPQFSYDAEVVVSRMWWKLASSALRACNVGSGQAARSRDIGSSG